MNITAINIASATAPARKGKINKQLSHHMLLIPRLFVVILYIPAVLLNDNESCGNYN
jgi:hypothetical protein